MVGKIRLFSQQLFGRKDAISLIIFSWITLPFFIVGGSIAFLLIIIISFSLLFRKKIRAAILLFLFSPYGTILTIAIISAAISYFSGTAVLKARWIRFLPLDRDSRYDRVSSVYLDRDSRCYWVSPGCIVWGYEWLYEAPNDFTVRGLAKLFGPMKGAYRGIYPSYEDAQSILLGEKAISFVFPKEYIEIDRDFLPSSSPFPIRELVTVSDRRLGFAIERLCWGYVDSCETESGKVICKFSIIKNELLVLGNCRKILLIDLKGKRIIAEYFSLSEKRFF